MKKLTPHSFSFLAKMFALILLVAASFATLAQAQSSLISSISWQEIPTQHNLAQPSSIAVSPVTHDYVAIASDKDGEGNAAYYFLDHTDLAAGWQKRGTFEGDYSPDRVLYGADRFIITCTKKTQCDLYSDLRGHSPFFYDLYEYYILSSLDNGSFWKETESYSGHFNPEQEVTFINVGSDASYMTVFALQEPSEETRFVAIGSENFIPQDYLPYGPHGIVVVAGDDENGWIGVASDGRSYFGAPNTSISTRAAY